MVSVSWPRRIWSALASMALVVLLGGLFTSSAYAVDCTVPGVDDPPGCTDPSPTPSATPDPVPTEVVLSADQFDAVFWVLGATLAVSLVGVVGSWSK